MEQNAVVYLSVSRIVVLFASMTITYGLYDQALKLLRIKSASEVSWPLVSFLLLNEVAWLNYGIALTEWPVILISTINIPAVLMIVRALWKEKTEWS